MARLLGIDARLTPVHLADMNLRATRPVYCALSNAKLHALGIEMPTWQESLKKYLQSIGDQVAHQIADRQ
jgi:dTDP-4-dehydrorhamnose reductase